MAAVQENMTFLNEEVRFPRWQEPDIWPNNNSSFDDYCANSQMDPLGLKNAIRSSLKACNYRVGLDLAGGRNGAALIDLKQAGLLDKALLTTYSDRRSEPLKNDPSIGFIDGDLIDAETWQRIISWRKKHAPQGFNLVMHRPVGALQDLRPETYIGATRLILDNLAMGGLFFTQIPVALYGPNMKRMCLFLETRVDIENITLGKDEPFTSALIIKGQKQLKLF